MRKDELEMTGNSHDFTQYDLIRIRDQRIRDLEEANEFIRKDCDEARDIARKMYKRALRAEKERDEQIKVSLSA